MTKNIFILKILLPSVICFILIHIIKISFSFYPLSFGLVIGIINWNIHKNNSLLGVLLSILVSYGAFLIAFFSFAVTGATFDFMDGDSGSILGLTISAYIIAPLLLFLSYTFVFRIPKNKLSIIIIIISVILLIVQNYFFYSQGLNQNSINSFTGWQVIMALALQLMIYQKELKKLFNPKKTI